MHTNKTSLFEYFIHSSFRNGTTYLYTLVYSKENFQEIIIISRSSLASLVDHLEKEKAEWIKVTIHRLHFILWKSLLNRIQSRQFKKLREEGSEEHRINFFL